MKWIVAALACAVLSASLAAGGEEEVKPEEAKVPKLPEGDKGIAAKYPGDKGIEKDAAVIFAENFESGTPAGLRPKWNEVKNSGDMSFADDVPEASASKRSLLYTHVGGKNTGGHLYKAFRPGHEHVYLRFYTKFASDCNPIHHFVHIGGLNPQTNWPQGGAGNRPNGAKRFTTAVEPHGRGWRWDYYTYWKDMGGSPPRGQTWGNSFLRHLAPKVTRGKWTCLELMAKMNDVGETNGEQALWVDGKLVSHLGKGFPKGYWIFDKFNPAKGGKSVRWSDQKGGPVYAEIPEGGLPFKGFEWRTSKELKVSYLWILLYITKAPNGKVSKVWFDDIVLAKEYIGPIKKPEAGSKLE